MLVSLLAEVARNYFELRGTQNRLTVARQRYQFGVVDFLAVLVAERTSLEAQDRLADSETLTTTALVAVYTALGVGWEIAPERAYSKAP
jgi:outer membrane protein, multidrug efflux system